MEYENQFWIQSHLPTGYSFRKNRTTRKKLISESDYDYLRQKKQEGLSAKEIALHFGCSEQTVKNVLRQLNPAA